MPTEFTAEELQELHWEAPTEFTTEELQEEVETSSMTREILENLGDRRHVLKVWRSATPKQREQIMQKAPGMGEYLRQSRGGAVERTVRAGFRGLEAVAQPIMELAGAGGTEEEIAAIHELQGIAARTFDPATPQDPWYERGPLQAVQMAPWMATVIGGRGVGRSVATRSGLASGMARMFGMGRKTVQAAELAGLTAAGFPSQYAQELDALKEAGVSDEWRKPIAVLTAAATSAIEGIVPNPFKVGPVPLDQGAITAVRAHIAGALRQAPGELSEEFLQGLTSGIGTAVATHLDENAPDQTFGPAFLEAWEQGTEAIVPLAFLMGAPAAVGAGASAARANQIQKQLKAIDKILAKGYVTEDDARSLTEEGLEFTEEEAATRTKRKAAVEERERQLQKEQEEIRDAQKVREDQGVPEEAGEIGQRGEEDRGGDVQQTEEAGTEARDTEETRVETTPTFTETEDGRELYLPGSEAPSGKVLFFEAPNDANAARRVLPEAGIERGDEVYRIGGIELEESARGKGLGQLMYLDMANSRPNAWFYNSQSEEPATRALEALADKGYIELHWSRRGANHAFRITDAGKQYLQDTLAPESELDEAVSELGELVPDESAAEEETPRASRWGKLTGIRVDAPEAGLTDFQRVVSETATTVTLDNGQTVDRRSLHMEEVGQDQGRPLSDEPAEAAPPAAVTPARKEAAERQTGIEPAGAVPARTAPALSSDRHRELAERIADIGVKIDYVKDLYSDDPLDALATNLDLDSAYQDDIDALREHFYQDAQKQLSRQPDELIVYRGGPLGDGVQSFSLDKSTANFFGKRTGIIRAYRLKKEDVLGTSLPDVGTFAEREVVAKAESVTPAREEEAETPPPVSQPEPQDQDPYRFQDSNQEKVVHDPEWKKGNSFRYVLEGTGDVFRESTKDERRSKSYIEEKLRRLERQIRGERGGPSVMHGDDTRAFSLQHNQGRFDELTRLWEQQPTQTKLQEIAKELNLATIAGDWNRAESLIEQIRSEIALPVAAKKAVAPPEFAGTQVSDAAGNPRIVFHGTRTAFEQFAVGGENALYGRGISFTSDPNEAERYSSTDPGVNIDLPGQIESLANELGISYREAKENLLSSAEPSVVEAYVNLQNPLVVDANGKLEVSERVFRLAAAEADVKLPENAYQKFSSKDRTADQIEYLMRHNATQMVGRMASILNHDGLILKANIAPKAKGGEHYIAFNPNQVQIAGRRTPKKAASEETLPTDYSQMKVDDLKAEIRRRGLSGYSGKRRDGLIQMLEEDDRSKREPPKQVEPTLTEEESAGPKSPMESEAIEAAGIKRWGSQRPREEVIFPQKKTVDPKPQTTVSQAEANRIVDGWKSEAKRIGQTQDNSNKVIFSLFDYTGVWSQPWVDAGYTVIRYDRRLGDDLLQFFPVSDIMEVHEAGMEVAGVLAACPCTTMASSGARWWKDRQDVAKNEPDLERLFGKKALQTHDSPHEYNTDLVMITTAFIDFAAPGFYAVENPTGRIGDYLGKEGTRVKPTMRFDPHYYGDPYTKKTGLWGDFNTDLPQANVEPTQGSKMHRKSSGDPTRSDTPEGFAYAFFMANHEAGSKQAKPTATKKPAQEPPKQKVGRKVIETPQGISFHSGLTRSPKDLAESISQGQPVGVSAFSGLSSTVRKQLVDYANQGGRVFIDSGAFTAFTKGKDVDWDRVLFAYHEMVTSVDESQRQNVFIVAPDVVGNHEATLELQQEVRDKFQPFFDSGATVIFPVQQGGHDSIAANFADLTDTFGDLMEDVVVGVPFNAKAWSQDDVLEFMRFRDKHAPGQRVHLLGGGIPKVKGVLDAAAEEGLSTEGVSGDALPKAISQRKQKVGRKKPKPEPPRKKEEIFRPTTRGYPVTLESLQEVFNLTPQQAQAVLAIAESMELDLSRVTLERRDKSPLDALEQISEAAEKMRAEGKKYPSEAGFFAKWNKVLRSVGGKRLGRKSTTKVVDEAVEDMASWMESNPEFQDYYSHDNPLERAEVTKLYPELADDANWAFYKIITAIASPGTNLDENVTEQIDAWENFRDNQKFDVEFTRSGRGAPQFKRAGFQLHGAYPATKALHYSILNEVIKQQGGVEQAVKWLVETVPASQIRKLPTTVGGGETSGKQVQFIRQNVEFAWGTDEQIPRMFIFGPKVGAYALNHLGQHEFTTVDVWESRFWRSFFRDVPDVTGIEEDLETRSWFLRAGHAFADALGMTPAEAQAMRWFYVIQQINKAGYGKARSYDTISGYTRREVAKRQAKKTAVAAGKRKTTKRRRGRKSSSLRNLLGDTIFLQEEVSEFTPANATLQGEDLTALARDMQGEYGKTAGEQLRKLYDETGSYDKTANYEFNDWQRGKSSRLRVSTQIDKAAGLQDVILNAPATDRDLVAVRQVSGVADILEDIIDGAESTGRTIVAASINPQYAGEQRAIHTPEYGFQYIDFRIPKGSQVYLFNAAPSVRLESEHEVMFPIGTVYRVVGTKDGPGGRRDLIVEVDTSAASRLKRAEDLQAGDVIGNKRVVSAKTYSDAMDRPEGFDPDADMISMYMDLKGTVRRVTFEDIGPSRGLFQGGAERQIRGRIVKGFAQFISDGKAIIGAVKNPDVSTALHELAHVARRQLLGDTPRGDFTAEDIAILHKWAGVKDGKWTRDSEEKFARAFERYMREGKAPTSTLESVFQKLAEWMADIYKSITGSEIDIEISPEMRGVFDKLVKGRSYEAAREEGSQPTVGGHHASIEELGAPGSKGRLITAEGKSRQVTYVAVETERIIPSHDARRNFVRNEGGDLNERPYHDPKQGASSRQTVAEIAEADPEKLSLLTADSPTPIDGPPMSTDGGVILGGNARAMGVQLAYHNGGEAAARMKEAMVKAAKKFDIDTAAVEAMEQPIIVRIIEEVGEPGELSAILNEALTTGRSQATTAVSRGKRISTATATKVSSLLSPNRAGEVPSLREVLSSPAKTDAVVQAFIKDGVWTDADVDKYIDPDTNSLNEDGKLAVEQTLLGRVIDDPTILGNASRGTKQKILAAIGPLTRGVSDTKHGRRLAEVLRDAAESLPEYKSSGVPLRQYFMQQKSILPFAGQGDATVMAMVDAIDTLGPLKFKRAMNEVIDSLGIDTGERQASLLEERAKVDSVDEAIASVLGISSGAETGGVSGEASKPTDRPDIEPKPGSVSGAMLQPVQMPELVQIAKDLMEGKVPKVKRTGNAAGRFKGMEGVGPQSIIIAPETAADEQALSQTLAHEIGHLIDFLPENTLKRGNLLGRLQSLRDFLKSTLPPLDKKDQARIRRQAKKEAGKNATKAQVDAIYRNKIKSMGLLANSEIKQELLDLTKWWSGDYTGGKDSYVKYRESSRELYAEALSVFLNSPGDLESRAPVFYKALLENLNTKPDVLAAYSTLQQMLNGTGQELAEARTQTLREMFGRAEEHINNLRLSEEHRRTSAWSGITDFLGQYFITSAQPVLSKLGRKPFKRGESAEAEAARFALDELFTIDSPNHTFLRQIDEQVYQPLIEIMQKRGLDRKQAEAEANFTLGEYLYHWRVVNERDAVANPAGFTATPSESQLQAIKARIGDDAYAQLQTHAQKFHDFVYAVAEEAANEGVYNRETFDEIITPNKDNYAAFRVTHYIDSPDIIATGVIKQVGTFEDIQNPFHSTILKTVRLNRLIELNRAKNRVRVFLEKNFPNDITPVETVFAGEGRPRIPRKHPGRKKEHLIELVDGRPTYFEVPSEIAKSFVLHDIGGLGQIATFLNSATYKVFHPFFVTYNPGFVLANPFRDLRRTWINLGATDDIKLSTLLKEWARALPVAVRRAKGLEDSVIQEMLESHALDIPYTSVSAEGIESQVDHLFQKYGLRDKPKRTLEKLPVIGRALELIEHAGAVTETATKVAGWRVLEEKGVPVQERSYRVRKYVGTPDYKQRGLATALTNSAMMYSRVRWNGLQADISLATNPETAAGWWWRQLVNVVIPTSLAKLGAYGAFGAALRYMFGVDDDDESAVGKIASWADETGRRVAKYFLTDYDVIPLGVNTEGKAVFITIPRDDLGKFIARTWWHATDLMQLTAGGKLREGEKVRDVLGNQFTETAEELLPSYSPPIEIVSKWTQYASGINPVDEFYNQQIIPQKEWKAGGWYSDSKMIAWTLDNFGAPGALIHYPLSPLLGESMETGTSGGVEAMMKTAGAMTGLKRFLRISNSGLSSEHWSMLENAEREDTAFRLSLPHAAQEASTRRYFLMRREALGDELSDKEKKEMHGLNLFYNAAYLPLRKMIQAAEDAGKSSKRFRDDMQRAADDPIALIRKPPATIRDKVRSYAGSVINAAVVPPPDPSDYDGRPRAFTEATTQYIQSRQDREDRVKAFGITHAEAEQLLREYYMDRYGSIYNASGGLKSGYRERDNALFDLYYR